MDGMLKRESGKWAVGVEMQFFLLSSSGSVCILQLCALIFVLWSTKNVVEHDLTFYNGVKPFPL